MRCKRTCLRGKNKKRGQNVMKAEGGIEEGTLGLTQEIAHRRKRRRPWS